MAKTVKPAPKKASGKDSNGTGTKTQVPGDNVRVTSSTAVESLQVTGTPPQAGAQPTMRILGQYLKDFSFENPNAPQSLTPQQKQPDINISVNVNARNLGPNDFEVELHLDAKASGDDKVIFAAELLYAGIFRLEGFPQNQLHANVLIECPRILFPFARQIMADATRNGGFPPLMLDPIDFAAMYIQRMRQQASVAQA
jgi:preprotein translocase subunit SecB